MGLPDAVEAVRMIKPKIVVPMHYNTTLEIKEDPEEFKSRVEAETESEVRVLAPGECFAYSHLQGEVMANASREGGVL